MTIRSPLEVNPFQDTWTARDQVMWIILEFFIRALFNNRYIICWDGGLWKVFTDILYTKQTGLVVVTCARVIIWLLLFKTLYKVLRSKSRFQDYSSYLLVFLFRYMWKVCDNQNQVDKNWQKTEKKSPNVRVWDNVYLYNITTAIKREV